MEIILGRNRPKQGCVSMQTPSNSERCHSAADHTLPPRTPKQW